tara:strand:- start:30902 stop:31309 length:408 start_codon:yes stop_codon:yes gene_type:complete
MIIPGYANAIERWRIARLFERDGTQVTISDIDGRRSIENFDDEALWKILYEKDESFDATSLISKGANVYVVIHELRAFMAVFITSTDWVDDLRPCPPDIYDKYITETLDEFDLEMMHRFVQDVVQRFGVAMMHAE